MNTELAEMSTSLPADRHPVATLLARLAPGSRRSVKTALETIAELLSGGRQTAQQMPWHELRYQHTNAVRAILIEKYSPATARHRLSALRNVLTEAWRLGLMPADDYQRAIDLAPPQR